MAAGKMAYTITGIDPPFWARVKAAATIERVTIKELILIALEEHMENGGEKGEQR